MRTNYDYIIAGSGCAGLSLLMRMMQHPFFNDKQILVIDREPKTTNDHTWCFWETAPGLFEPIIHHRWEKMNFFSPEVSTWFHIAPYTYKMIRSIDFYNYVLSKTNEYSNIHFCYGNIEATGNENDKAYALMNGEKYYASYLFNSIPGILPNGLLQHFKGWLIQTDKNVFDNTTATFMDFRVSQQQATTFAYMLPLAPNRALVEYTLISKQLLTHPEYDAALRAYINTYITKEDYTVTEEEFGAIPMTTHKFPAGAGNIINIGTTGGQTKPSSGFTFQFIQKHSSAIINALIKNRHPRIATPVASSRFRLYDSILLHILRHRAVQGPAIFTSLFQKNSPGTIFRFLDNETSFTEELKIMSTMPSNIFAPALISKLFKK